MAEYRAAIIGLGNIASEYEAEEWRGHPSTHIGAYRELPEVDVTAVADTSPDRLEAFTERWGEAKCYQDAGDLLANEQIDLLSICTPHNTHCDLTVAAAESGVRGVVLEKPMANNLAECDRMLEACGKSGTKISICYLRRWSNEFLEVKEIVDSGDIGELCYIHTFLGRFKPQGWQADATVSGGFLGYDPTHLIDMLHLLAGEPDWVSAHIERRYPDLNEEDFVTATYRFQNGVVAHLQADGHHQVMDYNLILSCTDGRLDYASLREESGFRLMKGKDYQGGWRFPYPHPFPATASASPQVEQVRDLIDSIEQDRETRSSGRNGRRAIEMTMALYESARQEGAKVSFPFECAENPLLRMIEEGML